MREKSEDEKPLSFRDWRMWAGTATSAGVYLGLTTGWGVLTSIVLGVDFVQVLGQLPSQKAWAVGLIMGVIVMPAFKIGRNLQSRVENIRRSS